MTIRQGRTLRTGAKLAEGRLFEVFELLEYPTAPIGSRLVIKRIRPALAQDEAFRNRLHKLFETLPRLRHPYAEEVLDAQAAGPEDTYLVCERLDGETLETLLRREGRLPLPTVRQLARQIAEAVIVGHSLCIVHGNLTPSHIVITQPRRDDSRSPLRIKVRGFGLAPPVAPGLYGTPSYLAPEQVDSLVPRLQATQLADQHALAVILYEALVGRLLFPRSSLEAVRPRLLRQDPPYFDLRGVSSADVRRMNHALQRALAKGPESRFPRLLDFIEAVEGKRLDSAPRHILAEHRHAESVSQALPAAVPIPAAAAAPPTAGMAARAQVLEESLHECDSDSKTLPMIRSKHAGTAAKPGSFLASGRILLIGLLLLLAPLLCLAAARTLPLPAPSPREAKDLKESKEPKEARESKELKELSNHSQNFSHAAAAEPASPSLTPGPSEADSPVERLPPGSGQPKPRPQSKPVQCHMDNHQENTPDVKRVAGCFAPKLARDLQGATVTVLFSRRKRQFDLELSGVPNTVRDELEQCLSRLAGHDYDSFPDSGVSWSCRR